MSGARIVDIALTVFFLAVGVFAIADVRDFPFQDQLFPFSAAGLILICVLIYGARQFFTGPLDIEQETGANATKAPFTRDQIHTVIPLAAAILVLVGGVFVFGHLIAVPAFAFGYILLRGEKLWIAIFGAVLLFAFIWRLLINVMEVLMPRPLIMDWLGL